MKLVAPFRPFPKESVYHQALADFDWIDAIRMLSRSAEVSCGVPVHIITDVDTDLDLDVPILKYRTEHRRLMLWTLEACLRYLESDDFVQDTVMLDCDQLILKDLRPWFGQLCDLTVLMRTTPKHQHAWNKLLNGVQFWSVRGKKRLIALYRHVLAVAEQLPDADLQWGGDTIALRNVLEPMAPGFSLRSGVRVRMVDYQDVLEALSEDQIRGMAHGIAPKPTRAVFDFRYGRKLHMRQAYEMTVGKAVAA